MCMDQHFIYLLPSDRPLVSLQSLSSNVHQPSISLPVSLWQVADFLWMRTPRVTLGYQRVFAALTPPSCSSKCYVGSHSHQPCPKGPHTRVKHLGFCLVFCFVSLINFTEIFNSHMIKCTHVKWTFPHVYTSGR